MLESLDTVTGDKLVASTGDETVGADQPEPLTDAVHEPRTAAWEIHGAITVAVSEHPSENRLAYSKSVDDRNWFS